VERHVGLVDQPAGLSAGSSFRSSKRLSLLAFPGRQRKDDGNQSGMARRSAYPGPVSAPPATPKGASGRQRSMGGHDAQLRLRVVIGSGAGGGVVASRAVGGRQGRDRVGGRGGYYNEADFKPARNSR